METGARLVCLIAAISAVICVNCCAADAVRDYPNKPIRLVVPFAPGNSPDLLARRMGQQFTEAWHQQTVIDNRVGAGGVIGHNLAAKAAPDGYTLVVANAAGLVLNPLLYGNMPYDAVKDFAPISLATIGPQLLVVHPQVPVATVRDLIALAKVQSINFASSGNGSGNHLAAELFNSMAGIKMVHVPYRGGAFGLNDLVAGQVQVMFNTLPPVLPLVKAGRLKTVAITSLQRMSLLPDVPAIAEVLPGYQSVVWYGVFAPAGTSRSIIDKINTQIVKTLANPELVQRFVSDGSEPRSSTPEELTRFVAEDRARWKQVIADAHIAQQRE